MKMKSQTSSHNLVNAAHVLHRIKSCNHYREKFTRTHVHMFMVYVVLVVILQQLSRSENILLMRRRKWAYT